MQGTTATMTPMDTLALARTRALRIGLALALAGFAAACGSPAPSPTRPSSPASPASTAPAPTSVPTEGPSLTPVPGASAAPTSGPAGPATTVTDWGTILDAVPEGFPVYPGARRADLPEGPNSGAWIAGAGVDKVAPWYRDSLEKLGFTTDNLSSPLEDGSRVLDTVSDLPECRIQTTFRPADGSTMIIVLYGAGCAGGEG
jgi:hypothetical protein